MTSNKHRISVSSQARREGIRVGADPCAFHAWYKADGLIFMLVVPHEGTVNFAVNEFDLQKFDDMAIVRFARLGHEHLDTVGKVLVKDIRARWDDFQLHIGDYPPASVCRIIKRKDVEAMRL